MNPRERKVYEALLFGLSRFNTRITFKGDYTFDEIKEAFESLMMDHPELYYVKSEYEVQEQTVTRGLLCTKTYTFKAGTIYPRSFDDRVRKSFDDAEAEIRAGLPDFPSERVIALSIVKYIARNCQYSVDNTLHQNAAAVLTFGRAQCSGYARAFCLLMSRFDVECIFVPGRAGSPGEVPTGAHAWNIAKLDGRYRHIDATYTDTLGGDIYRANTTMYLDYFNKTDADFRKTHVWNESILPSCR